MAGFDWLDMSWVYKVLLKKGAHGDVVKRISRLYDNSYTIVVVNKVKGKILPNLRNSLRQGDVPSMFWFAVGIDPLLRYLHKRLSGIPIHSLPVYGPVEESSKGQQLNSLEQRYRLIAYADDVKPSITSMAEFILVDNGCMMLEKASGVKLHRNPAVGKVKFLALGKWQGVLQQEHIPFNYIKLSDHLDFLGVELRSTYTQTRKANGDQLQTRIRNTIGPWKAGRFMPLTMRPYSANTYALSKVWFKCYCINLRVQDIDFINSQVKSWIYQDCLEKPSELVLYRNSTHGGLGLINVKIRALALLIRSFLETAINPLYQRSIYHEALFKYYVLGECLSNPPLLPPYYDISFFNIIKYYLQNCNLNVEKMTVKQWYIKLLKDQVLMTAATADNLPTFKLCRIEALHPDIDWTMSWKYARMPGLSSESTSFLFRLMHHLLPVRTRIARMGVEIQGVRQICPLCQEHIEDLVHAFFTCSYSCTVGLAILGYVQKVVEGISPQSALCLQLGGDLHEDAQLAVISILAIGLKFIWDARCERKVVSLHKTRAEIEANIEILRRTRFTNAGELMLAMIS